MLRADPAPDVAVDDLLAEEPGRWPVLSRAFAVRRRAPNPRIVWTNADGSEGWNFCQIVRTPFYEGTSAGEALAAHFDCIEFVLVEGVRSESAFTRSCGGVRSFLGRDLVGGDHVALLELRDARLRTGVQQEGQPRKDEWLSEFSLEVIAG